MNRIKEAKGNLIDLAEEGHFDVIAHGCNCQNVMGRGIAKEIKDRLPDAELADFKFWKENKSCRNDMLGRYSISKPIQSQLNPFQVANLYTQLTPGPVFELRYLRWSLESLLNEFGDVRYAIPKIGAGLGGGKWVQIRELIYTVAEEHDLTIIHYD